MNIIAVDDEILALKDLEYAILEALPDSTLSCFTTPKAALAHTEKGKVDIAFLDIEMGGMNGLTLAKKLKDICGTTNIVFVTGYSEYAVDSYSVQASGYILKPVSEAAISEALRHLRDPLTPKADKGFRVQTFGNFEVFMDGRPLHFPRSKSKELFAYLIHKKGTSCTVKELAAVLFEEKEYDDSLQRQMQTIISTMIKVLADANVRDVVVKNFNNLAVDTSKVNCDVYRFHAWDLDAVNEYAGEYMSNYSWAEFMAGYLDRKIL